MTDNMLSKGELKFWIGILMSILGAAIPITYWGAKIEGKFDVFAVEIKTLEKHITENDEHDRRITTAVNDLFAKFQAH
jgi:hypothetical protein